jgi:hypothetical protein
MTARPRSQAEIPSQKQRGRPEGRPPLSLTMLSGISLPAQAPLLRRLHHDCCQAQANGSAARECKERDPHGDSLFLLWLCLIPLSSAGQRRSGLSVPGTFPYLAVSMNRFEKKNCRNQQIYNLK